MTGKLSENKTASAVLINILIASAALFAFGFGVYLTIQADIGAGPWDVFELGLSGTFGILYGTASICVSMVILVIDILLREPIGIAMFIDAMLVGKAVDLCNYLGMVKTPKSLVGSIVMMLVGLVIMGYAQYFYMCSALGCGPRDTLLVGLKRKIRKIPIGLISVVILALVTFAGYLLGGKVGIGTLICAFLSGPIMQFAFMTMRFDPTGIRHQNLFETVKVLFKR